MLKDFEAFSIDGHYHRGCNIEQNVPSVLQWYRRYCRQEDRVEYPLMNILANRLTDLHAGRIIGTVRPQAVPAQSASEVLYRLNVDLYAHDGRNTNWAWQPYVGIFFRQMTIWDFYLIRYRERFLAATHLAADYQDLPWFFPLPYTDSQIDADLIAQLERLYWVFKGNPVKPTTDPAPWITQEVIFIMLGSLGYNLDKHDPYYYRAFMDDQTRRFSDRVNRYFTCENNYLEFDTWKL